MIKESSKKALKDIPAEVQPQADKVTTKQDEDYYDASIIVDYDGKVDELHLENKDPKFKYRYLNTNQKNLARKTGNLLHNLGGWQIVPKKHLIEVLKIPESFISSHNDYRVGPDLVLARIPKELYEKKEAQKVKEANAPMSQVNAKIEGESKELDGYGHESMKGIQTAEQLGLK